MPFYLIDLGIILVLVAGISRFRTPRGARAGNLMAATALLAAAGVVLIREPSRAPGLVSAAVIAGAAVGSVVALRVHMIQIPAMVAFQHGMGGVAAFLIAYIELNRADLALTGVAQASALLGLVIGAATFSGSMVASGKLANRLRQTPLRLPGHNAILATLGLAVLCGMLLAAIGIATGLLAIVLLSGSIALGIVFSIRIGGADMPVLISFLNATAGLAAALCGIALGNRLLVACGATVAASGSILTHVMCRAMNRGLIGVFTGIQSGLRTEPPLMHAGSGEPSGLPPGGPAPGDGPSRQDPFDRAADALRSAQRVIIIPGYGMALADAQEEVVRLGDKLAEMGKELLFAIHPVAGRMPGHMHVLLAEADVDYSRIRELKDVNPEFARTDLALIVGACDVVNPAAMDTPGTPISGMPILRAHEARQVIVCNLDDRPGYSGVDNPLYRDGRTILLFGDAKATVSRLLELLSGFTSDRTSGTIGACQNPRAS